ncbi:MAG: ComEC/Rec2 family competence protein, partial [Coriobacteriia bacterium]
MSGEAAGCSTSEGPSAAPDDASTGLADEVPVLPPAGSRVRPLIRPSLPPLAWVVVALWSGIGVAEATLWRAGPGGSGGSVWLLVVGCAVAVVASVVFTRIRWTTCALLALGLSAGAALGGVYWTHWNQQVNQVGRAGSRTWVVEVLTDETPGRFGSSSRARIVGPVCAGALVTVEWPEKCVIPLLGREAKVVGSIKTPAADQWGRRSFRTGIVGSLSARRVVPQGWSHSVRGAIGPLREWAVARVATVSGAGGDLLAGVLLGDRRRMTATPAETDFRTTGLTHLVAVSGSHLVVVAAVAGWLLMSMGLGLKSRSAGIAAVVGAYVVFSGVQPSAVRAWVMAMAAALAWVGGRRADGGSTLAVAAAVVLVASPISAFDLGFRLSVAAVAGLVLLARLGTAWIEPALPRVVRGVAEPISMTLAATVSTLPIIVPTFQMLSLVSPVANILVGPLVSVVLLAGLVGLAAAAISPAFGALVLGFAGAIGALSVSIAGWLASWPHASIPMGFSATLGFVVAFGAIAWLW